MQVPEGAMRHRVRQSPLRPLGWGLAALLAGLACLAFVVIPSGAASTSVRGGGGGTAWFAPNDNFSYRVASDVQSVTAGETLSGTENWGFNVNNTGSELLTGVHVDFDAAGSGADYTNSSVFGFNYTFFPTDPNAFVPNHGCPAPSASQESCPSPPIDLPPGDMTMFTGNGVPTTGSVGYDATRTVTPIPSTTDSDVSVSVTLDDPRYQGATPPDVDNIRVTDEQANADTTYPPTVTSGGQALPTCPEDDGKGCVVPADFGAYKNGDTSNPCEAVSMYVQDAQEGTPYVFDWHENESGAGGCPVGEPGVGVIGWVPAQQLPTLPCDAGTDCSGTRSIAGVGNVTVTVDPNQITGFDGTRNVLYLLNFAGTTAPPPPAGSASSAYGSTPKSGGTATATNDGTTATGTGTGIGALTVSQFASDPVSIPPFDASGQYFDVQVLSGSKFDDVALQNCNLSNGTNPSGDWLDWWNGTDWVPVAPQSYTDGPPACITATLSGSSSPTLKQLGGTPFAVVDIPILSLTSSKLTLFGTRVKLPLRCAHLACRGTVTLSTTSKKKPRVLARTTFILPVGKTKTIAVSLDAVGKKALARVTHTRPYTAQATVRVTHGATLVKTVRISR